MIKFTKEKLRDEMNRRNVKVPALEKATGIPKDRIYAWYRDNTNPKREDQDLLERWLNNLPIQIEDSSNNRNDDYLAKRLALKNRNTDIAIPFYDVEAIGGQEHGADMTAITKPTGTVDIGDFLRDSKAALRVYGNSMIPNYPPGCVVGLIEKPDRYIHPGHVYVIETGNDRYVKRLYYSDDQTKYVCASDNHQVYEAGPMKGKYFYPLFEIPIDAVSRIYDVTGVIKRNINTIVLNH